MGSGTMPAGWEFVFVGRALDRRKAPAHISRVKARGMPGPARFSVEECHFSCIKPAPSCAVPTNLLKALPCQPCTNSVDNTSKKQCE